MAKSKKQERAIAQREAEAIAAFEAWFREQGYTEAVDGAPYDSAEGGYLGTIDAEDLLPDFFEAHGRYVFYEEALRRHCWELGELFNSEKWNFRVDATEDDTEEVKNRKEAEQRRKFVSGVLRMNQVRERFKK